MAKREDFAAELEQAVQLAARLVSELMRSPGIVAVGPGVKRKRGRPTGRAAIVVTVREKLPMAELQRRGIEPLPQEVEGVPVDVVEFRKPVEDEATRKALARAIQVKNRIATALLSEANVTGIGVGYKVTKGRTTGQIAIQIFVAEKLPPGQVRKRGFRLVPKQIRAIPTDVVQLARAAFVVHSDRRGNRQDPLVGGLSIGHASEPFGWGTLGAIVFDAANNAMALSNEHVLDGDIGETVHQPSPVTLADSVRVDFQLDVCMPLNFFRIDTPDTTDGTILAGAAAAAALAAALSDAADPVREGQLATRPPRGALTQEEKVKVGITYPGFPRPGTPFTLKTEWAYERITSAGSFRAADKPKRKNPHHLLFHRLFTSRRTYKADEVVELFGLLIRPALGRKTPSCDSYHCVALLRAKGAQRSFPVVLRPLEEHPDRAKLAQRFQSVLQEAELDEDERALVLKYREFWCMYYGVFPAAGKPLRQWFHWMYVQTVNTVVPGTAPEVAAQVIGGLPVSNNIGFQLDVACGPFVLEDDGNFDIEPL